MKLVNSTQLNDLLKYSQEDFKIKIPKIKNAPPPPMISDSIGFKITFIQNNKQNSFGYYAPKYYYDSPHKTINKPVLKKFIDVLDLF